MRPCPDKKCHVPDVQCRLGEATPSKCAKWRSGAAKDAPAKAEAGQGAASLPPWSGSALGTRDLAFLTARRDAKLIAILGGHNAGKTTLLAAWYQQVGRSGQIGPGRFAGSVTIEGWEAVGRALRWEGRAPHFPPHTSSGAGRAPGMLHFAVRQPDGSLDDFLFADSPGEWFERWAVDRDAGDTEGARWLVERASALIVVADSEALSGEKRGTARNAIVQLLRRTADERCGRPVALVWSKADVQVPASLREAVEEAAAHAMPDIVQFSASIVGFEDAGRRADPEASLRAVFDWALQPVARGFTLPRADPRADDPFFDFGRAA